MLDTQLRADFTTYLLTTYLHVVSRYVVTKATELTTMVSQGTRTQQKIVSKPFAMHPSWCVGGCQFTLARDDLQQNFQWRSIKQFQFHSLEELTKNCIIHPQGITVDEILQPYVQQTIRCVLARVYVSPHLHPILCNPWLNIRVADMQHFSYLVKAILEFMRRLYTTTMLCYIGKHFSSFVRRNSLLLVHRLLCIVPIGCVCVRLGAHHRRQPGITHGCVYDV